MSSLVISNQSIDAQLEILLAIGGINLEPHSSLPLLLLLLLITLYSAIDPVDLV
jgi:hypothetical protein